MDTQDIFKDMRKDIITRIERYLQDQYLDKIKDGQCKEKREDIYNQYQQDIEILSKPEITIPQLWALFKLTERKTKFSILPSNPQDYLAVTFAGMYIGIEKDGYTHS